LTRSQWHVLWRPLGCLDGIAHGQVGASPPASRGPAPTAAAVTQAVYVSGRKLKPGEINGKSADLNNCLRNIVYRRCRLPSMVLQ
jgi:hypothetical protein